MIKRPARVASMTRGTRRVTERADFDSKLHSSGFEPGLDRGRIKIFQSRERVAQREQVRLVLSCEMLRDTLWIVDNFAGEIEAAVSR